ncbi:MAG TPA: class I SAM-dependent methyltransferase [Methylophilaceae bacterium]|nr:class I SAM-dependent methyltransferase [Methylophilaceae bacterium]
MLDLPSPTRFPSASSRPEPAIPRIESIQAWLTSNLDKFLLTDPLPTLVEWLDYRISLSYLPNGSLVDLGGGVSGTNGFLSQHGMNVTIVDLFQEYYSWSTIKDPIAKQQDYLASLGVKFIQADLVECNLLDHFASASVDCIATYHTLEHLHHSPKLLLESAMQVLKPGGTLIIEVPNAANLLKRIKLMAGETNYPSYSAFYDKKRWVGHVREYTMGDLRQVADRLGLASWRIEGKNWYGSLYRKKALEFAAKPLDVLLQTRPGLCGSLFLIGKKAKVIH